MRDASHEIIPAHMLPRRHAGVAVLHTVGVIAGKKNWINRSFRELYVSCVTRGTGTYLLDGRTWRVQAPCVFIEWPGVVHRYGPDEGTTWDETFLCFAIDQRERLEASGFLERGRPCWPVGLPRPFLAAIAQIPRLVGDGLGDLADRLADQALVASLQPAPSGDPVDRAVQTVQAAFLADPTRDVLALIQAQPVPRTTFRRRWQQLVGEAPGRWALHRRLELASRLLADGEATVQEIAAEVGIGDPFYLTRRFRQLFGHSPSAHRVWGRGRR